MSNKSLKQWSTHKYCMQFHSSTVFCLGALGLGASVGCVSGNTTHPNGSTWKENECLECQCIDGTTSCITLPACHPIESTPSYSFILLSECTFEIGLCDWTNDPEGDVEWQRRQGSTPTSQTGPTVDHTLGTAAGNYIYMESSQPTMRNNKAILLGPTISSQHVVYAIRFWYHMYGAHTGTLTVSVRFASGDERELWRHERDQGNEWHRAVVALDSLPDEEFRVVLMAVRGEGYRGDIAVDDIAWIPYPGWLIHVVPLRMIYSLLVLV